MRFLILGCGSIGERHITNIKNQSSQNKIDVFDQDSQRLEEISLKLIYAQIIFAFAMQKKGGVFILKVFDMFTNPSFELIYFLMHAYNKVIIIKPKTYEVYEIP